MEPPSSRDPTPPPAIQSSVKTTGAMPGPAARRPHKKSRKGCAECKKRHIKCDEQHPECTNCMNHTIRCSFSLPSASSGSTPRPTLNSNIQSPVLQQLRENHQTPSPLRSSHESPDLNISDLELLHHFTTSTALTLSPDKRHAQIWQLFLTKEAFSHPFLLRQMFSMSALHLSRLRPSQANDYIVKATINQDLGLAEFRNIIRNITSENCVAVFAFAGLLAIHAFALPRTPLVGTNGDLEGILHCMTMTKGVNTSLLSWWPLILQTDARHLTVDLHQTEIYNMDINSFPEAVAISRLRELCVSVADPGASSAYDLAIRELQIVYAGLHHYKDRSQIGITCSWCTRISETYILLLKARAPEAMVILAFYAVLLDRFSEYWFLDGWGQHLIGVISHSLGPPWEPHLEFPVRMIGNAMNRG
ncbi:hypothetical protein B7494_g4414 [Chlorociboria aeruginascens]|nr:hypothetical protein B7494_g4414 [Chlorociboria aeruginascens]